ncbi:MAG TPA: MerR family transcriptional regulator [Bryobacteraceae bacterium]|nr:MerR family transcriptional regulator [Bryobacteraceae bacterium]
MQGNSANAVPVPEITAIPDKLYFRIGEVSRLAGVKPYVLRYWESEFPAIAPKKSGTGHRLYRRKDVEIILEIKRLLYEKRFTIEGARKALDPKSRVVNRPAPPPPADQRELFPTPAPNLGGIRKELESILKLLS